MKERTSRLRIGLQIRDPYDGHYTVKIRYYEPGIEKYIPTEFQVTREEWTAVKGDAFHRMRELKELLAGRINDALEKCGDDLSYDRFKMALQGKKLVSDKTLITLLDEHLRVHPEYEARTIEGYQYTRNCLVKFEKAGHDMGVHSFETEKDVKRLEDLFLKHFKIGQTTLSMHMRRIKAIAETGKDKKWIKNESFSDYEKPAERRGTVPNDLNDFMRLQSFECDDKPAWKFGRDAYTFMVYCGGMEAKSIALVKFKDVNKDHFRFMRAKIEKSADDAGYVYISMKDPFIKYFFETYGKPSGGPEDYVFPFLEPGMTKDQIRTKINQLAQRITKNIQKIARKLDIKPLPNCKRTRPTFAILADHLGLDIFESGKMMGHQKVTTTEIYYTHLPTERKLEISSTYADKLSKKLKSMESKKKTAKPQRLRDSAANLTIQENCL